MVDEWTSQGFRLLALASGTIKHVSKYNVASLSLQQAEAAVKRMSLLGLIVVTNQLRPDSRDSIHQLQDEGGMRTAMITGDYHQTAVSVAWAVGMVPPGGVVHIIDRVVKPKPASLSPPISPVQVASTSALFPRDAAAIRPPYSRWQSAVDSGYSPPASPLRKVVARQPTLSLLELPGLSDAHEPVRTETAGPQHFRLQCEGLKFSLGFGDVRQDSEAMHAMTSIAEGDAQCAITGAALEHLLQQEDLSVLEAVLQNAVVFARMRPHQKAQVLSLLGSAGLHQVFQGRHRHIRVRVASYG